MNKTAAESLGALVRRVREDNQWSLMDVVRNALPDHRITTGYISMIENHQVKKTPSHDKLRALAQGLRVELSVLTQYVMEPNSETTEDERMLVSNFRHLDPRGQRDLLAVSKTLRDQVEIDAKPATPATKTKAVQVLKPANTASKKQK